MSDGMVVTLVFVGVLVFTVVLNYYLYRSHKGMLRGFYLSRMTRSVLGARKSMQQEQQKLDELSERIEALRASGLVDGEEPQEE